ncbi:hypothetical protein PCA31118_04684 [Pandoraea captiosa]|uniref:Uncharacterized protein n=1 Tax=Pandoraea captiosa TaxID=2508302 RepID=A0A5E5APS7_9BURK|nr:hypothetical protein [Pandoraea captiosa]VVE74120.1 hypothetical protein PCA31118_04684 [Pandoraea captiosa]
MARRPQLTLLNNGNATGQSVDWPGGNGACFAEGTFGGATLTLQILSPNGTWMTLGNQTTFTANGVAGFTAPAGQVRMQITGGTPSAVYAYVVGIPTNNGG